MNVYYIVSLNKLFCCIVLDIFLIVRHYWWLHDIPTF